MMTSSNREDNIESIVGHQPDTGDEAILEIAGHELDDAEDEAIPEITGHELDDPGSEEIEGVTGDDVNGPGAPEGKSFGSNELKESKDKQSKTYTGEKNESEGAKRKFRVRSTWVLFFVTVICFLAGGSYYFFHHKNGKQIISRNNIFPVPHDQSIMLESFILPIQKKKGYTYISLNILLELSNVELKEEIIKKKDKLRVIIYDILEQGIPTVETADALETLKALIIKRTNTILTSGEVREAIITDFSLI